MPVIFPLTGSASAPSLPLSLSHSLALRTNDTGHRSASREAREASVDVDRPQQFSLDSHLQ